MNRDVHTTRCLFVIMQSIQRFTMGSSLFDLIYLEAWFIPGAPSSGNTDCGAGGLQLDSPNCRSLGSDNLMKTPVDLLGFWMAPHPLLRGDQLLLLGGGARLGCSRRLFFQSFSRPSSATLALEGMTTR